MKNMKNFWEQLNKPILALAPMAGITDSAFRQVCKKHGADVLYSEMVSADGLFYNDKKTKKLMKYVSGKEKYLVFQIFGKDPEKFKKAANLVEKTGVHGIDINFGCPARKVVKHGGGVTLMRDLDLCYELVKSVTDTVKIPVSVKIRTSIKMDNSAGSKKVTGLDFIKKIKDLPVSAVMVHGRSYEQGFSGTIDYAMIKKIKASFSGIVLANGGINTPEDAKKVLSKTGTDGLGLARGVFGQPWLFEQVKDFLKTGKYQKYEWAQIKRIILNHANLAEKFDPKKGIIELRKHLGWYIGGFPGAKALRSELVQVNAAEFIFRLIKRIRAAGDDIYYLVWLFF